MSEITLTKNNWPGYWVESIYLGHEKKVCLEAHVLPASFAEPAQGRLLALEDDTSAASRFRYRRKLRKGQFLCEGALCRWVKGLVRIVLENGIVCPACGAKDSIGYNAGIEKVRCSHCGVDASKVTV